MSTLLYNPYRGGWKSHKNCLRGLWMTPDLIPTFYKLKTKVLIIQVPTYQFRTSLLQGGQL